VGIVFTTPALALEPKLIIIHLEPRAFAKTLISPKEFSCLDRLFSKESRWSSRAYNSQIVWMGGKKYHAGGIPQILGLSIKDSPYVQIRAGIHYINRRYGSPCKAWEFWKSHYWY